MKPGDLIRHERAPGWGVGVVVDVRSDIARIRFENYKETTIKLSAAGAELVPVTADEIESDSPLLDASRWHEYETLPEERKKEAAPAVSALLRAAQPRAQVARPQAQVVPTVLDQERHRACLL